MARPKLQLGYDNLEDAKNKLVGGFALHKGKAVLIKGVGYMSGSDPEDNQFGWYGHNMSGRKTSEDFMPIDHSDFNVSEYTLGYMNNHGFAVWWYRMPYKQYHQALRGNQMHARASNPQFIRGDEFRASNSLALMLENKYPHYSEAAGILKKQEDTAIVAFHRNFAFSLDRIHGDFILEYKGESIGYTHNLNDFKLMKEHEHLYESLQEAIA